MERKELQIVSEFRNNARENLTTASRKLRIPVSTIYDRLKKYQGNVIKKHTALLDFGKLGFGIHALISFKMNHGKRPYIEEFLENHHRVNTVFKVSNNSDYLVEVICKNMLEFSQFKEILEKNDASNLTEFLIVEEILRESFLTNKEFIDLIADEEYKKD